MFTTSVLRRRGAEVFSFGGDMGQTKIDSVLESTTNILIGMLVAICVQMIWFPAIGKEFTLFENVMTTCVFTTISFFRSYLLRRAFNNQNVYLIIKEKLICKSKKH